MEQVKLFIGSNDKIQSLEVQISTWLRAVDPPKGIIQRIVKMEGMTILVAIFYKL